ncbi:MAG: hypothetical protein RIS92_2851 [Verrucomicrobiota bacterium]
MEVIDDAHAVPNAELGCVRPDERGTDGSEGVLGDAEEACSWVGHFDLGRIFERGAVTLFREQLVALALTNRVVAKGGHPVACEKAGDELVLGHGFAVVTVSARHKYGGPRGGCFGEVEVAGEVEAWARFEKDFFDAVTGALECAGDFWVERCSLGETADAVEEEGASFLLPSCAGGFAGDGAGQFCGPFGGEFREVFEQPMFKCGIGSCAVGERFEDGEVVLRVDRGGEGKEERECGNFHVRMIR